MRLLITAVAGASLLALTVQGAARLDDEIEMPFDQAPAAVRRTIAAHAPGPVRTVEAELEGGVLIYEAEWELDGVEHEIEVAEDGELLALERDLSPMEVPLDVINAVGAAVPGGAPGDWTHRLVAMYEVTVVSGGVTHELLISPAGAILEQRTEGDDD